MSDLTRHLASLLLFFFFEKIKKVLRVGTLESRAALLSQRPGEDSSTRTLQAVGRLQTAVDRNRRLLETQYWGSVEDQLPTWRWFLLGKGPDPTDPSLGRPPRKAQQRSVAARDSRRPPLPRPRAHSVAHSAKDLSSVAHNAKDLHRRKDTETLVVVVKVLGSTVTVVQRNDSGLKVFTGNPSSKGKPQSRRPSSGEHAQHRSTGCYSGDYRCTSALEDTISFSIDRWSLVPGVEGMEEGCNESE
ncbi:hypothetical protein N1851_024149 [Merluccius polli]|uniref:Uncharacterized protein n=1 Tax=Merluccius polli TaxID=89951 RepID=A0AA47NX43_MERPO|nr:hypothetical protein N1851_024149 [Merluccius polli]